MAQTVANVLAGKPLTTGGVLTGALGSTLPTDASTAVDAAFKAVGYISEDGLTQTTDRSTDKIRAWGGDIVKVVQSEFSTTYSFTMIEALNADAQKVAFGDTNVTTTAATTTTGTQNSVAVNGDTLPHQCFVFEVKDGDARIRIVVPNGQVTTLGEMTFTDSGVAGYSVTVEAFEDANGNNAYLYTDDGKITA